MEYTPRYRQPFTWNQLLEMEVAQMTQGVQVPASRMSSIDCSEIARLQHSLEHLRKTQDELKTYLEASAADPDIQDALKENEETMYVAPRRPATSHRPMLLQRVTVRKNPDDAPCTGSQGLREGVEPALRRHTRRDAVAVSEYESKYRDLQPTRD